MLLIITFFMKIPTNLHTHTQLTQSPHSLKHEHRWKIWMFQVCRSLILPHHIVQIYFQRFLKRYCMNYSKCTLQFYSLAQPYFIKSTLTTCTGIEVRESTSHPECTDSVFFRPASCIPLFSLRWPTKLKSRMHQTRTPLVSGLGWNAY